MPWICDTCEKDSIYGKLLAVKVGDDASATQYHGSAEFYMFYCEHCNIESDVIEEIAEFRED